MLCNDPEPHATDRPCSMWDTRAHQFSREYDCTLEAYRVGQYRHIAPLVFPDFQRSREVLRSVSTQASSFRVADHPGSTRKLNPPQFKI